MSELDAVIRDLRTAAAAINDAADTLSEMFSGETAEAPAKPTEPVHTKGYGMQGYQLCALSKGI